MTDEEERFHDAEEERLGGHNNSLCEAHPYICYDLMVIKALESTSRISQWLPDVSWTEGEEYSLHRLILEVHTPLHERNHLLIASVQLPKHRPLYSVNGSNSCKIKLEMKINHPGEVIRACYMPQNPCIIATRTSSSDVLVFDGLWSFRTQVVSYPVEIGRFVPMVLVVSYPRCWSFRTQGASRFVPEVLVVSYPKVLVVSYPLIYKVRYTLLSYLPIPL